jgi:hypothetical protein
MAILTCRYIKKVCPQPNHSILEICVNESRFKSEICLLTMIVGEPIA